jgi:serine/threonine protein kinase
VIPIYDTGSYEGLLYIAMRYVSGTDLRQVLKKRGRVIPSTAVSCSGRPRGPWTPRTGGGWCTAT